MTPSFPLILASTSIRRREILSLLGLPFETVSPIFEERFDDRRPAKEEAIAFAEGKAMSVRKDFPRSIIIGSDTLIEFEGEKIGKPENPEDAIRILAKLQGHRHRIWTGVALIDGASDASLSEAAEIKVEMGKMTSREIEEYVATGEPLDKAGAYSLQEKGRRFIKKLEGDYLAAVGLPLMPIVGFLRDRGISLPVDITRLYSQKAFYNWRSFGPDLG